MRGRGLSTGRSLLDPNPGLRKETSAFRSLQSDFNKAYRERIRRNDRQGALEIKLAANDRGITFGGITRAGAIESDLLKRRNQNKQLRQFKLDQLASIKSIREDQRKEAEVALENSRLINERLRSEFDQDEEVEEAKKPEVPNNVVAQLRSGAKSAIDLQRDRFLQGKMMLQDPKKPKNLFVSPNQQTTGFV